MVPTKGQNWTYIRYNGRPEYSSAEGMVVHPTVGPCSFQWTNERERYKKKADNLSPEFCRVAAKCSTKNAVAPSSIF